MAFGVMMCGFVSREFGFGMALTTEQLQRVNAERLGKKYKDESAAKKKRGSEFKQGKKSLCSGVRV